MLQSSSKALPLNYQRPMESQKMMNKILQVVAMYYIETFFIILGNICINIRHASLAHPVSAPVAIAENPNTCYQIID